MPKIDLTPEQADELRDTIDARIDDLSVEIEDADPVEAIGLRHVMERLQEIMELLEIA